MPGAKLHRARALFLLLACSRAVPANATAPPRRSGRRPGVRAKVCIQLAHGTETSRAASRAFSMSPTSISDAALWKACDFSAVQYGAMR